MSITTKRCSGCGNDLLLGFFCSDRRSKDGKQSMCKKCKSNSMIAWDRKNRDTPRLKERRRIRSLRRYRKDRVGNNISRLMRRALKKGGRKWVDLVSYTADELRVHLEAQFQPGMTWANYGQWEVDHKRPRASFSNLHDPTSSDFAECWALINLQPLWRADNRRKSCSVAPIV